MKVQEFDVFSDVVVIGRDPEMADYDNPRGEVYGFCSYVRAIDKYGDTRILRVATERFDSVAIAKAEKVAAALNARLHRLCKLPVGFDAWEVGRPVYGSQAYIDHGQADDLAWEARELAEEAWR